MFSFGFAEKFYSDNKLGFSNSEFEKILGGSYYARILYKMVTHDDQIIEASCLGLSQDRELAATKAFMEYLERYAFSQQLSPFKTAEYDDRIINDFLSLYRTRVSDGELSRIRSGAFWGINLCTGNIHAIPLRFVYNMGDISHVKPTSSGFAAHVDFKRCLSSSIMELIERDAFVRFWHEPLRAYKFSADQRIQIEIDNMVSVLRLILENENIVSNCFVVESPTKMPVAMLTISSSDFSKPPSLNFGFGVGCTLAQAVMSALEELRVNVCNMIEGVSSIPGYLNQSFHGKIEDIPDRMNYYSTSIPRARLGFLDMNNPLIDDIYTETSENDFSELVERFSRHNMAVYGIDITPECFKDKNVYVTRAFSPNLYPLQFVDENVFNLAAGKMSVKDELPHFFI